MRCMKGALVNSVVFTAAALLSGCQIPRSTPSPQVSTVSLPASTPESASAVTLAQFQEQTTGKEDAELLKLPPAVDIVANTGAISVRQPVEYFVASARLVHPRIQAARARLAAASNRGPQATSLEDPVLTNNFYPISDQALQTASGRAGNTLSVTQKYPWPEKRWIKGAIANREAQIAAAKLSQVELEIEEATRLAYYELWFADRAIRITEDNRQIAAELVTLAEARNAAGGSQQDVLRAQLQLDSLDNRLITLRQQKAVAQADLAALIGQPTSVAVEPVETLDVTGVPEHLDALFAAALECNPRLRERQWAVSRDRQKQQLACLGKYPDFMFGAGWQTITESDAVAGSANGHDNVSFIAGLTLPIWRGRINAAIREASADVAASSREFADARDDTYRQVRRLSDQAYAADEQLSLYNEPDAASGKASPAARFGLTTEDSWWTSAKSPMALQRS